ncbi:hypothetical protein ACFUJR_23620 [Streptomyces sp. NPDC057271]|uniref:hypothetical protein n=1 Tax=unclassified Streptomyces TaxID=2593676 RepID=UPI00364101E6
MIIPYRVVGPCRALLPDGREAPPGGARPRALLMAPDGADGRGVRTGELIELIREDDPHGAGAAALQAPAGRPAPGARAGGRGLARLRLPDLLLLLDDCEHGVGAAAKLLEQVPARCPG